MNIIETNDEWLIFYRKIPTVSKIYHVNMLQLYKSKLNTNQLDKHTRICTVDLFLIKGVGRNFVSQPCLVDQKTQFNLNTSSPPATSLGIVEIFNESLIIKECDSRPDGFTANSIIHTFKFSTGHCETWITIIDSQVLSFDHINLSQTSHSKSFV